MATIAIFGTAIAAGAMDMARDAGARVVTTDRYLQGEELEQFMRREQPDGVILRLGAVTEAAMVADPNLKIIAKHGVGYDTIDVEAASRRGILISIATGANAISVAEHALGLMLATARGIAYLDARIRDGHWDKAQFLGTELNGKTLGIVGLGAIGRHLASLATALGMNVQVFDPALAETPDATHRAQSLEQVLEQCDVVSLHCPLNASTRNMMSTEQFARMKPGAILINTARGGLVDIDALGRALRDGQIGGAGLDTFPVEPVDLPDSLRTLPNLVVSPHVGASTFEAGARVGTTAMKQVLDYLSGREVESQYVVNDAPRRLAEPTLRACA